MMNIKNMFLFNKTVMGYKHNPPVCEDASVSLYNSEKDTQIFVVADGHGDRNCVRSRLGSEFAAQAAVDAFEHCDKIIDSESDMEQFMSRIEKMIILGWYKRVNSDINEHPLSEEEYAELSPQYAKLYKKGEHYASLYGTTLIAGFRIGSRLFLFHQGDGRCEVFWEDGSVSQPVPWDDRCEGFMTTSMCNEDVADSIRHLYIDLQETPIVACFLGSDGVEDAFSSMEGTHSFYRSLLLKILESPDNKEFDEYLGVYLREFSRNGSRDDVSVAGIVDVEAVAKFAETYETQNMIFSLNDVLITYQQKKNSMERKHDILKDRMFEAEDRKQHLMEELRELNIASNFDTNAGEEVTIKLLHPGKKRKKGEPQLIVRDDEYAEERQKLQAEIEECESNIQEYQLYDEKYMDLCSKISEAEEEIARLKGENQTEESV